MTIPEQYSVSTVPTKSRVKHLEGKRFGRWLVISHLVKIVTGKPAWFCKCECERGTERVVLQANLLNGTSQSCGCLRDESIVSRSTKHGQAKRSGLTREYVSWTAMLNRCSNPHSPKWKDYGGRGITVCAEWHEFEKFFIDNGPRPEGTTLDRIDNEKGYFPGNTQWANPYVQGRNKRTPKSNTSGVKGVYPRDNRYRVGIRIDGVFTDLGSYPKTPDGLRRASEMYRFAEDLLTGGPAPEGHWKPHNRIENATGVEGVCIHLGKKYVARWTIAGKRTCLGYYCLNENGLKAAAEAVRKAKLLAEILS